MATTEKLAMSWPAFAKQPINNYKLSGWDLSFRGDISASIQKHPKDYATYSTDINDDEVFYRYNIFGRPKDSPFLYIGLGRFDWELFQVEGGYQGGSNVSVSVARVQNIPGVIDVKKQDELERAVQTIFDKMNEDGDMLGPDFCWVAVNGKMFFRENRSNPQSSPRFVFFLPIDHRHVLVFNCNFGGFVPLGELLPPPLFEGIMDGVKDFLSHVQLEKSED